MTTTTEHADRLADWEIQTIEAVAREDMDAQDGIVWDPDKWLAVAIAKRQARVLENAGVRAQLAIQAQRLGIGHRHPAPVAELEPLPTPDDTLGSRWCRITLLKLRTDDTHPWSLIFHELVTAQVAIHRHTTHPWSPDDAGTGILELLESEAQHAGLIAGPAPELAAVDAAHQMLMGAGA